jgi:hypothetical protein
MKQRPEKLHKNFGGIFVSIGNWSHKFSGKYLNILEKFFV